MTVWRRKNGFFCTVLSEPLFCNLRILPHVYFYSYLYLILIFKGGHFFRDISSFSLPRFPSQSCHPCPALVTQDNVWEAVDLSSICLELQEFTSSFWVRFLQPFFREDHAADDAEASLRGDFASEKIICGSDSKEAGYNAGDLGSVPELRRSLGRREWQPIPKWCLPGESHGKGSLVGNSPWGQTWPEVTYHENWWRRTRPGEYM